MGLSATRHSIYLRTKANNRHFLLRLSCDGVSAIGKTRVTSFALMFTRYWSHNGPHNSSLVANFSCWRGKIEEFIGFPNIFGHIRAGGTNGALAGVDLWAAQLIEDVRCSKRKNFRTHAIFQIIPRHKNIISMFQVLHASKNCMRTLKVCNGLRWEMLTPSVSANP